MILKTSTYNLRSWMLLMLFVSITIHMNAQSMTQPNRPLTPQQQSTVIIAALTVAGDMEKLPSELHKGLDSGLTVEEIKEMLVQLYAYCGFPRSLNAIGALMEVTRNRKSNGLQDKPGTEYAAGKNDQDKYEKGRKVLEELTKTPQTKPAPGFGVFAPRIDAFLKEHLFADIFESDVLSYQQRELVTISALSSMPGAASQLQYHVKIGQNTGITGNQLAAVAQLIEQFVSKTQANTLRNAISIPELPVIEANMMVRISEIEIEPEHRDEYNAILKEEAAASVAKEPGVLAIFPMSMKEQPNQVRIVEIYADSSAYQSHLKTPHFQHYKTSTLKMVKCLKLVDMNALDQQTMLLLFKKLK